MKISQFAIATIVIAVSATGAFAAQKPVTIKQAAGRAARSAESMLPLSDDQPVTSGINGDLQSLGRATSASIAPGVLLGDTWYDMQHVGSIGRMVDWGVDEGDGFQVHFSWMRLATEVKENRHYAYNRYNTQTDALNGMYKVQPDGEYAGYVGIDVKSDGRACVGGHNNQGSGYQSHFYFENPGIPGWANCRVPDSVSSWGSSQDWHHDSVKSVIWPKFRYQDVPGEDHVLHIIAQTYENMDPGAIYYFRKVGLEDQGVWGYPPYVVDTGYVQGHDVACSNSDGKFALVWIANLPAPGDCDTCSNHTTNSHAYRDNDIYYQVSYDYGVTFEPRVNLTKNVDGEDGYRPWSDASALIDSDNNLHIGWGARSWPADAGPGGQLGLLRGRLFHWGENLGLGGFDGNGDAIIRTAASLEWDQTTCNGGAWQLNGAKISVSECDGKLYFLWTQFNDIPNGIEDDCHNRAFGASGNPEGSANGELYLAVSANGGMNWDAPRNLTNTRTPNCDSINGPVGRCQSEAWPSMARLGTDHAVGSNVVIVDPSGGYVGDYFLDVQYIDDPDPGAAIQDEGTWQQSEVRWFRMPCVEPVPHPGWAPSWTEIDYPENTKHGTQYDKALTIENPGNTTTNFTMTLNEDAGPHSGWLSVSASLSAGIIDFGEDNTVSGTVTINAGGTINLPGTIVNLTGNLTATGNMIGSPYVFPISFYIADTVVPPVFDTISTGCFSLVVSNTGNFGNQGVGHVNLDFFDFGDCDDLEGAEDNIPGDATVYLNDASPVICWTDTNDTVRCNWSLFGQGLHSDNAFVPMSHAASVPFFIGTDCEDPAGSLFVDDAYMSSFVTHDTGLMIEKWWIHPNQGPFDKGANWIIQVLRVSVADGQSHTGLNIGEAIDWDIPADTATRNRSGFDASNRLVYQRGSEYDEDPEECQENSDRYGGIALVKIAVVEDGISTTITDPYGAWTGSNARWVYPMGGFIPNELDSLMTAREGYVLSDSLDADLHSVMTFVSGYTLTPTTTITVFTCLITSRLGYPAFIAAAQECHQYYSWYLTPPCLGCCVDIGGNVDGDPGDQIDISDLVYLVDYMFNGGPPPPCQPEGNVDSIGGIDISDLVYLVDYMFSGGPAPPDCACCK